MINFDEVTTMSIVIPQQYINCPRDFVTLTNVKFVHSDDRVTVSANAQVSLTEGSVVDGRFVSKLRQEQYESSEFCGSYPEHCHNSINDVLELVVGLVDYSLTNKGEDDTTYFGLIALVISGDETDVGELTIKYHTVGTMLMIDIDWVD